MSTSLRYVDKATGTPCPTAPNPGGGTVLCTITDRDHRHRDERLSGEAGGLEAVLAAHNFGRGWCEACGALWHSNQEGSIARHAAAAVRVWLTEALAAPEVVEAAAVAINVADNKALADSNFGTLCATYDEQATAALSAAADALRAGVTR